LLMHRFGNAPGDRAGAGDADDQGAFSIEKSHDVVLYQFDRSRLLQFAEKVICGVIIAAA
jgi:hypothetical protein